MKEQSINLHEINIFDLEWGKTRGYPEGARVKELIAGKDRPIDAILLKLEPGWHMNAHSHLATEIHYILDGQYQSQGKVYKAGTFRIIPKEAAHGPFSTRTGATVLVIWVDLPKDEMTE